MKFQKPKEQRLHKRFWGVHVDGFWWVEKWRVWTNEDLRGGWLNPITGRFDMTFATSVAPCRSIRAFKRMLRKNPSIRGRARLISRFQGYDVWA